MHLVLSFFSCSLPSVQCKVLQSFIFSVTDHVSDSRAQEPDGLFLGMKQIAKSMSVWKMPPTIARWQRTF